MYPPKSLLTSNRSLSSVQAPRGYCWLFFLHREISPLLFWSRGRILIRAYEQRSMESPPPASSVAQAYLMTFAKPVSQGSRAFAGDASQTTRS
jgi:hypothetical protein